MLFLLTLVYGVSWTECSSTMGTVSPKVQAVDRGGTIVISCYSEGSVKWLHNMGTLPKPQLVYNKVLIINNAGSLDKGNYTCLGSFRKLPEDTFVRFQDTARVFVARRAQHRITPQLTRVDVGDSAYLSCLSSLHPRRRVLPVPWIFENAVYADGLVERRGFNSIYIESANLTHNGWFTCYGLKRSKYRWVHFIASSLLQVFDNSLIEPNELVINRGDDAYISCLSHSEAVWYFNGKKILMFNARFEKNTIVINNVSNNNVGHYDCEGQTDKLAMPGLQREHQTFIARSILWILGFVLVEPWFQIKNTGITVTFHCKTYSLVKWTFNKGTLPDNAIVSGAIDEILTLYMIYVSNAGVYECAIKDQGKKFSSVGILEVTSNQRFSKEYVHKNIHAKYGDEESHESDQDDTYEQAHESSDNEASQESLPPISRERVHSFGFEWPNKDNTSVLLPQSYKEVPHATILNKRLINAEWDDFLAERYKASTRAHESPPKEFGSLDVSSNYASLNSSSTLLDSSSITSDNSTGENGSDQSLLGSWRDCSDFERIEDGCGDSSH